MNNNIIECPWPDCGVPLNNSDIYSNSIYAQGVSDKPPIKRCRYCFGALDLSLEEMLTQIEKERNNI